MKLIIEDQRLTRQLSLLLAIFMAGLGFIKMLPRHLINPRVSEAVITENKLKKFMDESNIWRKY
ncbi:hypothetical protein OIU79_028392 [Salix purpurea]|uniref:Uncharacterized protein n=1 Tax=Salix purpurea TaxID=77065 RepID=A0A9Q1A2K7_SALPP|nr:hypothetical protein OIU79_028392 [Salix purpurea]